MNDNETVPSRDFDAHQAAVPSRKAMDDNKDSALPCAKEAHNKTEKLECLTKAHEEHPGDPQIRAAVYEEVKEVVDRDPFLEYHAENTQAYRVIDRDQEVLIVPKERAKPEMYPVKRPQAILKAYRFLLFAALGLVLSGLGAVIFAPVAVRFAFQALDQERDRATRARARFTAALAFALFAVGLALVYIFWMHIRG